MPPHRSSQHIKKQKSLWLLYHVNSSTSTVLTAPIPYTVHCTENCCLRKKKNPAPCAPCAAAGANTDDLLASPRFLSTGVLRLTPQAEAWSLTLIEGYNLHSNNTIMLTSVHITRLIQFHTFRKIVCLTELSLHFHVSLPCSFSAAIHLRFKTAWFRNQRLYMSINAPNTWFECCTYSVHRELGGRPGLGKVCEIRDLVHKSS